MTTIAFASWKGGTGKTTLAFNTAERANADGVRTLLCDFDPQATALRQHQLRQNHSPDRTRVTTVKASMSDEGIAALKGVQGKDSYDLIICDLPGADSFSMDQALNAMDLILIPIMPSPYEVMITANLVHRGVEKGWRMALVPNNLPAIRQRRDRMLSSLSGMGIDIAPVTVTRRVTYWDASLIGLSVAEFQPKSAAAQEMTNLWKWIAKQIDDSRRARTRRTRGDAPCLIRKSRI